MAVELGTPVWTEGLLGKRSAENDLGMEAVGAALLRRLLPGILETTPHAGYYAFYSYLVAKWEQESDAIERSAFKPFFRRHELAYAIACRLHAHRDGFQGGIQGSNGARAAIEGDGDAIGLSERAETYIDEAFGGYGLFYQRVLQDIRLTQVGAHGLVDRATERGKTLAHAFASEFEQTRYYRDYFTTDVVPTEVLAELGQTMCLCAIPGRAYQQALMDVFFGDPEPEPVWEASRQIRVNSLGLHLAYHQQRPATQPASRSDFRAAIAGREFENGSPLKFEDEETTSAWRAYQLRECETLVFTALWSWYLRRLLEEVHPMTHAALRDLLVAETAWPECELDPSTTLEAARSRARSLIPDGAALVRWVEPLAGPPGDRVAAWTAHAVIALITIDEEANDDDPTIQALLDDGGPNRWSLRRLNRWLTAHADTSLAQVLGDLIDELREQHLAVATAKLSDTDRRDPFCIAEDNGLVRLIRPDDPFWTGARFGVVQTLLWSLDLIGGPTGDYRPTAAGTELLRRIEHA